MKPRLVTILNALILMALAISPVNVAAQQAPASSNNVSQQSQQTANGAMSVSSTTSNAGTVHARPFIRSRSAQNTTGRSSGPHLIKTGGGDKTGKQGASFAKQQTTTAKTYSANAAGPAAGGGDKSIEAQGAVSLGSPLLTLSLIPLALADSAPAAIQDYFVYLTTDVEPRLEKACYVGAMSSEEDSTDRETCKRQMYDFVNSAPIDQSLLNQDSYEASMITEACSNITHDLSMQLLCFQAATSATPVATGTRSTSIQSVNGICNSDPTPGQCFVVQIGEIANEPSTVNLNGPILQK